MLSRTLTDPVLTGIPFVDAHGAMRAGQLVEVCGVGGSGKTEILMQAAVNCALPRERDGVRFGGCESSVLLLDLDGKFDTLRLLKILTARVEAALARETRDARTNAPGPGLEGLLRKGPDGHKEADDALVRLSDSVYRESVGRFQMVRCHNSLDFLKALAVVDKIFERREALAATRAAAETETDAETVTKKRAAAPPRRLLLVDNVAAFYWLDRASRRDHDAPLSLHNVHHVSARALMEISRRCRAPVVATKAVAATKATSASDRFAKKPEPSDASTARETTAHKDFLPPKWTSAVTQRLVLEPMEAFDDDRRLSHENDFGAERFRGRGGYGASFVARWELPAGRPTRGTASTAGGVRVV